MHIVLGPNLTDEQIVKAYEDYTKGERERLEAKYPGMIQEFKNFFWMYKDDIFKDNPHLRKASRMVDE